MNIILITIIFIIMFSNYNYFLQVDQNLLLLIQEIFITIAQNKKYKIDF